jgi:hypothetical protein
MAPAIHHRLPSQNNSTLFTPRAITGPSLVTRLS